MSSGGHPLQRSQKLSALPPNSFSFKLSHANENLFTNVVCKSEVEAMISAAYKG
jgi:hypothetical protein